MYTDPIADLLTRIRNGYKAQKLEVRVPFSKVKEAITKVLVAHKFVRGYKAAGEGVKRELLINLSYDNKKRPAIENIRRVSKPGLRVYQKASDLKKVLGGYGMSIVSTSAGMMSGKQARKKKLGGEVLAEVW